MSIPTPHAPRPSVPDRSRPTLCHAAGLLGLALMVACTDGKDSVPPADDDAPFVDSGSTDPGAGSAGEDANGTASDDGEGSTGDGSGSDDAGDDGTEDGGSGEGDDGGEETSGEDGEDDSGSDDAGSDDAGSSGSGSGGSGSGGSGSSGSGSGSGGSGSGGSGSGGSGSGGSGSGGSGTSGTIISVAAVGLPTDLPSGGTTGTVVTTTGTAPSGTITDVDLLIDLDHTCTQDLVGVLVSPSGTTVTVFDMSAYPVCSSDMENTILDDEASVAITSGRSPFTGAHQPTAPLSAFDGEDAAGIWTLTIEDRVLGDSGELHSWSLDITIN